MRTLITSGLALAGLCVALTAFGRQQNDVITRYAFEADNDGWNSVSSNGLTTEWTKKADTFKEGAGALEVRYKLEKGQFNALAHPVEGGAWGKLQQLRFWLKTDQNTPFAVALHEKDGGHYYAIFWSPKDTWQRITLAPADFTLGTDKNDPKDPNNKLDTDKLETVILMDLANLFIQADNPAGNLLAVKEGDRKFWVDEFEARSDAPTDTKAGDKNLPLDTLGRDFLSWMPLGSNMPAFAIEKSGKPLEGRALKLDYTREQGKLVAATRAINKDLTKYKQLQFDFASEKSGKFIVIIEERNGARYQATFDSEGDKKPQHKAIAFSEFQLASEQDAPPDPDGKLDLDSLKMLTFADLAFLSAPAQEKNTLWLGSLRATP